MNKEDTNLQILVTFQQLPRVINRSTITNYFIEPHYKRQTTQIREVLLLLVFQYYDFCVYIYIGYCTPALYQFRKLQFSNSICIFSKEESNSYQLLTLIFKVTLALSAADWKK